MEPTEDEDLLLQVLQLTKSGQNCPIILQSRDSRPSSLAKCQSFDSLIHELFNEADQSEGMDIQQGFFDDSKCGEEAVKLWQPPPRQSSPKPMDVESPSSVSQPVSGVITNIAQTLEYPGTLQMTQEPRHPIPDPELVGSGMSSNVPTLPVFKSCPPRQLPLLETVDVDTVEMILSPLSSPSGTEVTQAAQTPQMDVPPTEAPVATVSEHSKEAKMKSSWKTATTSAMGDLNRKVTYIQKAIARYHKNGGAACSNGKIQVHEVVLVILHAAERLNFNKILSFCAEDGTETDEVSENFMTRDTKSMGLIWQRLKGNRNGNYDTFARAMRVGRERHKDYFDYLSGGKSSRKRIYKLGQKATEEFNRMKGILE